jgi:hypothetical protein|eukprot:COSAG01_NODE_2057_length_8526_cov_21.248576_12_plen_90_part_00
MECYKVDYNDNLERINARSSRSDRAEILRRNGRGQELSRQGSDTAVAMNLSRASAVVQRAMRAQQGGSKLGRPSIAALRSEARESLGTS